MRGSHFGRPIGLRGTAFGLGGGNSGSPVVPADYVVTNGMELATVLALPDATLDGKIIEQRYTGYSQFTLSNRVFPNGLTFRSADAASHFSYAVVSDCTGVKFVGCNFKPPDWPKKYNGIVRWTGLNIDCCFNHNEASHGYSALGLPFVTDYDYPEYDYVTRTETATTSSTAYALNWYDPTGEVTDGEVKVTNSGSVTVDVKVGNASVDATTGGTTIAAGETVTLDADPTTATHIALLSSSGTASITVNAGIGMPLYLADLFSDSGDTIMRNFECIGNYIHDVSNAFKNMGSVDGDLRLIGNRTERVYQDHRAYGSSHASATANNIYVLENIKTISFSKNTDVREPHGDGDQLLGGDVENLFIGMNLTIYQANRPGADGMQTEWLAGGTEAVTNNIGCIYVILNNHSSSSPNQLVVGTRATVFGLYVLAIDFAAYVDGFATNKFIRIGTRDGCNYFVGRSIFFNVTDAYPESTGYIIEKDNVNVELGTPLTDIYPLLTDPTELTTAALVKENLASISSVAGLSRNLSLYDPTEPVLANRFDWANMDSGLGANTVYDATAGATVTIPIGQVLNYGSDQIVLCGADTEYRFLESDNSTIATDWTTADGLTNNREYGYLRVDAHLDPLGEVTAGISVNGQLVEVTVVTAVASWDNLGTVYFKAPSNAGAGKAKVTFAALFKNQNDDALLSCHLFAQEANDTSLELATNGDCVLKIKDSAGAVVLLSDTFNVPEFAYGQGFVNAMVHVDFTDIDAPEDQYGTAKVVVNGEVRETFKLSGPNDGGIQDSREFQFLASNQDVLPAYVNSAAIFVNEDMGPGNTWPTTTEENRVFYLDSDAVATNAHPWKAGTGDVTQN